MPTTDGNGDRGIPGWAIDLYSSYGSPDLSTHGDVYVGPLIGRKSGLRKDDIVEMVIDARSVRTDQPNVVRGCLLYTSDAADD